MTDPASIFSIVSGSAGLVLQLGKVINDLHNVSERFRLAELTISSMRHSLTTVQWAWRRIKTILDGWEQDDEPLPDDTIELFAQLNRSLQGGSLVISALEDDLKRFQEVPGTTRRTNPTQRARIVWNEQTLKDHQERIRDQVSSMTLVLEVMRMPEPAARKQALDRGERVFQQSDESAFSIVPSKFSRSIRDSESLLSFESEPSLVYHELSVDSDLFTARVYKRNYRTAFIRKLLRKDKVLSVKSQGVLDRVQGVPAAFESVQKDPDTETVSETASESSVASLELPDNWIVCPAEEWETSKQKARDMAKTRGSERYDMNKILPDLSSQSPRILPHHTPMWKVGDVSTLRISGFDIKEMMPEDYAQICGEDDYNVYTTALVLLLTGNTKMPLIRSNVCALYGNKEPIELAFHHRHLNIVKLFMSMEDYTYLASEILYAAIEKDDVVLLASLLALPGIRGNLNYRYQHAKSPLHLACQHGSLEFVSILCKRGADTEVRDDYGKRAADYVPFNKHIRPVLVASSIRQCFTTDASSLTYQQASKALGYLDDLENLRKISVTLTAQRLGLDEDAFIHSHHEPSSISSMIEEWVKQTQERCFTIESLYTEVYSRCRNRVSILTLLLPPTAFEPLGPAVFDDRVNIISAIKRNNGAVPEDYLRHWKSTEWSIILKSLDRYLDTAISMIKDCSAITGPNSLSYCGNDYPCNGKVYVEHWVFHHWFGQYARDLLEIMAPVILRTDNVLVCEIILPRSGTVTELDDPGLQYARTFTPSPSRSSCIAPNTDDFEGNSDPLPLNCMITMPYFYASGRNSSN
ncbi:MAG: hypothetical protein LQ348_002008 [Seirophora lacunosa]|nr:MAG: hypothetical protein LQ348_002008 [Seirophora lacunosa]